MVSYPAYDIIQLDNSIIDMSKIYSVTRCVETNCENCHYPSDRCSCKKRSIKDFWYFSYRIYGEGHTVSGISKEDIDLMFDHYLTYLLTRNRANNEFNT